MTPQGDDYTFLWRTIMTIVVSLGLPWIIKMSNEMIRMKMLLEQLSNTIDKNDANYISRMNTQSSRHQGLLKRVTKLELLITRRRP